MGRVTVAAVGLLLALSGCSSPDLLEGEVTSKTVIPGTNWVWMMPIYGTQCSGSGTTRVCTQVQTGSVPIMMEQPPCYQITVSGKTSGETCVSQKKWDRISEGDGYVGEDVSPRDQAHERS